MAENPAPQKPAPEKPKGSFASKTMAEHIFRGVAGGLCLFAALIAPHALLTLLLLAAAFFAFRGCPFCWSFGLFETSCNIRAAKKTAKPKDM